MTLKKITGLCHGVFDVVHYGHLKHFESAKKKVDILVVSVSADDFVNKGPGKPIFNINQRIEYLKSLKLIDKVIISKGNSALKSLQKIKPDFFFKGSEYNKKSKVENNLFDLEKDYCKRNKIKIIYTNDITFSSSKIVNEYNNELDREVREKIKIIKQKYSFKEILKIINNATNKKILIFGDSIIDSFDFCESVGMASKSPTLALTKSRNEKYLGGSFALAKMLQSLQCPVELISYFPSKKFSVLEKLGGVKLNKVFKTPSFPMIERVVDEPRFSKIAQIYNNSKITINHEQEKKILKLLKAKSKETFFVIDFGIGIFTQNIVNFFNKSNVKYFLNCHLNSINAKYAYFEKFKKFKYITFNKREFEFSFKGNEDLVDKIKKARDTIKSDFAVTIGFRGSYLINKKIISHSPAIYKKIIDPVGCGDAYFAMTSLLKNVTSDLELINFLGNLYAGMHGMFICNEKFVNKRDFLNTIKTTLS